ncbi:sigma 54-interacting transcriptional regulator [Cupriavidus pinatubonensis]|uniref:HTH-type transcriptional regulatory protein TyrR n=1 Tax=Cupriavidus pinatubonensis TaxID=248026 RepID=A0ABM8Y0E4_9BURK|nr:sigma 54-interacting transcriptional regulator [Cupriavidus pinatubonensis]CAG9186193.1 Transcriptional regulatory protein TyrR [Cupriavidus pinatubonensis]
MRIDVQFADRVGIAQEVLAKLAERSLNVTAVEVDPPHIFIEAPALDEEGLNQLRDCLLEVAGVLSVSVVAMLPGARRQLYLEALLASQADPMFAVEAEGRVVLANGAAVHASGMSEDELLKMAMQDLIGDPTLLDALISGGYHLPVREVEIDGVPYMLETMPLHEAGGLVAGAVLTLHAPSRIGERMSALVNYEAGGFEAIVGNSPEIELLKQRAARMAPVDAPLLITGETGTGKELLAHACHAGSNRRTQPFFALNCAALPENLAESELFGYAAGAFTGALKGGKPGLLELADGGTVFLDEVGEMSLYLQAKLLRFLNDGSFRRVGGDRELKADVRIISATHRSLEAMVEAGRFRQDLLFRLNVLTLHMPALRDRPGDILPLTNLFLARAIAQTNRPAMRLSQAACAALLASPWVGNVRELQNVVFRAVTMADRPIIHAEDLELARAASPVSQNPTDEIATLEAALADYEKKLLQRLYRDFPSSRRLAKRLGASHSAIATRLRRYGIS